MNNVPPRAFEFLAGFDMRILVSYFACVSAGWGLLYLFGDCFPIMRPPRCVSTGPVVVRLAEMANERERERASQFHFI